MHLVAFVQKASENPVKKSIMDEMLNICALNPTPESLKRLDGCKCFPIKGQSDNTEWLDHTSVFAIVDRRGYGNLFRGKLKFLDLTLEEVHSIQLLLVALNMRNRCISQLVA
jgi:hypothetical protein